MGDFVSLYKRIDSSLLSDERIKNTLLSLKFKQTKKDKNLFTKIIHKEAIKHVKNKISFFWYEEGRIIVNNCNEFDSYYNQKVSEKEQKDYHNSFNNFLN